MKTEDGLRINRNKRKIMKVGQHEKKRKRVGGEIFGNFFYKDDNIQVPR